MLAGDTGGAPRGAPARLGGALGRRVSWPGMAGQPTPASVEEVREALARVSYLADEPAALVSFLAQRLGKPVLVEGPAGVGKTELAKALARATDRELVR